jgi:hypothetical protein
MPGVRHPLPFPKPYWAISSFCLTLDCGLNLPSPDLPPPLRIQLKARYLGLAQEDHQQNAALLNICSLKCLSQLDLTQMLGLHNYCSWLYLL